jgi:hypothetical protein
MLEFNYKGELKMGLRFNNTHIVEKMENLPFNELEVTSQVILFEKRYNDDVRKYLDRIYNCILSEIRHSAVYVFDCNESNPRPYIDEDTKWTEKQQEEIDDMYYKDDTKGIIKKLVRGCEVDTERRNIEMAYFLIKDRIFKLGDKEQFIENYREINIDFENERKRYNNFEDEMLKKIHKYTFEWGSNYQNIKNKFDEKGYHVDYLAIPLGQQTSFAYSDDALLLTIRHEIDVEKCQWLLYKDVYLMSKDGKCTHLRCKFDEFFAFIQEIKLLSNTLASEFEHWIKIADYDIKNFIEDNGNFLLNVTMHFQFPFCSSQIEKFYTPIYEAKETNVKAYVDTVRWIPSRANFTKDGKGIPYYDLRDEHGMYDHYSIGEAIVRFIRNDKSGLSPYDGVFYNHGEINEDLEKKIIYRDDEGIKYYDNYSHIKYYVKICGHFVPVDENEEFFNPYVAALEERKALVDRLMRAK